MYGSGASVRTALLDFRKAFDLVDHNILVGKLHTLGVKPTAINWIIDFLKDRKQRVKLNGVYSDWLNVPAGVPQGTRLGPWLFLVLINDLRLPDGSFAMWKFADDTTVSEIVPPSKQSAVQQAVDFISSWSQENRLQLNPSKCKELQSCFTRSPPTHSPVELDGLAFESVNSAKVLGVTIRDDFKWNDHIFNVTSNAAKRLYLLSQLKRAGICASDLVLFYCSTIRSVLECACQVFHSSLPYYLSEELERIQKRALRIIFPYASYNSALKEAGIPSLYDRRASLSSDLFNDIVLDINHKLAGLLPPKAEHHRQLRSNRKFNVPVCKTDRLKKSFIVSHSLRM